MYPDPKITVRHIPRQGIVTATADSRWATTGLTVGALVVALVLGFALPAKSEADDDRSKGSGDAYGFQPVKHAKVPKICAITIHGEERSVTLYPERCLRSEGFDHRLPRACANSATIYGRDDRVYSVSCLRSAGFRVAGH